MKVLQAGRRLLELDNSGAALAGVVFSTECTLLRTQCIVASGNTMTRQHQLTLTKPCTKMAVEDIPDADDGEQLDNIYIYIVSVN